MNTKITTEWELFQYLIDMSIYVDLKKSKDSMSHYDCYSKNSNHTIELKCRKKHYPMLILEKYKYDRLLYLSNRYDSTPIYINSTPEGIYMWNLKDTKPKWEERSLPRFTEISGKDSDELTNKIICYLNVNDAIKIL